MAQTPGIDVSNHQKLIDWSQVAASGVQFAVIKCSEGVDYSDPFFPRNWELAKTAGLVRGAYHFARPSLNSAISEAAHFLQQLQRAGGLETGDLLALDMEDMEVEAGVDLSAWTLQWLEMVQREVGFRPLLYTGRWYMARNWLIDPRLAEYGLWLAAYQQTAPAPPDPWPFLALWQHTNAGRIPGVAGNCDLDWFFGDVDQLRKYGKLEEAKNSVESPQSSDASKALILAHLAELRFHANAVEGLLFKEEGSGGG